MVDVSLTQGPDVRNGTDDPVDRIFGLGGNDIIRGLDEANGLLSNDGINIIRGGLGDDEIIGGDNDDILFGDGNNDQLTGGAGDDLLYGGPGNDIILGQEGENQLAGGPGNDTLTGLGELEVINGEVVEGSATRFDTFLGQGGMDTFNINKASDDQGRLFVRGQKYALISDFNPENETIMLPGSPGDYVARLTGENNDSTAIFYTENPDINIGFSVLGVSFGTGVAIDVPNQTALVAIIEDVTIRNMFSDVYEYKGV